MHVFGRSNLSSRQLLKSLRLFLRERLDETVSEIKKLLDNYTISGNKTFPEELVSLLLLDTLPKPVADNIRIQYEEKLMNVDQVLSSAKALMLIVMDRGAAAEVVHRQPMRRTEWSAGCRAIAIISKGCEICF